MTMERSKVQAIGKALEMVDLSAVEKQFGIKINIGGAKYDPQGGTATFKLEVASVVDGEVKNKDAVNFERLAFMHGLQSSDFGRFFMFQGKMFTICGLHPRANKFPILAKSAENGKTYKFPEGVVKMALGKK